MWLNQNQKSREQRTTHPPAELEGELAPDTQQELLLQAYLDKMSELLLEEQLRQSCSEDKVRSIAHVRTFTILPCLDQVGKKRVLLFLYKSGLLQKEEPIIDLCQADLWQAHLRKAHLAGASLAGADLFEASLRQADLHGADLSGANLMFTNLSGANLSGTNLRGANLVRANLRGANLSKAVLSTAYLEKAHLQQADLSGANLSEAIIATEQLDEAESLRGTVMPDGSRHP